MKFLITGSSGYIGERIVDYLHTKNIPYLGIDKRGKSSESLRSFNLIDRDLTLQTLEAYSPDLIIHCGTFSALAYKDNFLESFKEDTNALANILEFLKRKPLTRFMYFSSSYVYSGLSNKEAYDERTILNPEHNFGVAKLFFEQFILRSHANSVIFRLSSVFGEGKQQNPNAIKNMVEQSFGEGIIEVWGLGTRKMQYIHIDDVIKIATDCDSIDPEIYNLGGGDYISVSETADLIASNTQTKVKFIEEKPEGETLPFMSIDKIKGVLSGKKYRTFKISLREYIKNF